MERRPSLRHYACVFFVSMALLIVEIAVARVLSVALMSHFAFVAISLALFGLGLSGLIVYLLPERFDAERLDDQLVRYSSLFALSTVLSIVVFLQLRVVQSLSLEGFTTLSLAYLVLAVPFFFGGLCVSLLMTHFSASIGRIYFADLLGAGVGCLVVVACMEVTSAPRVVVVAGFIAAALSFLLAAVRRPMQVWGPVVAAGVCLVVALDVPGNLLALKYVKTSTGPYATYEAWNAFSRVSLFGREGLRAKDFLHLPTPGKPSSGETPETMILDIDGGAWTPMMKFDGDMNELEFLTRSVLYVPHQIRPHSPVLIIGAGGGRDILAAKASGQDDVLAIELNPLMQRIVQEEYGDYSGRPYTLPGVHVEIDEARSHLAALDRRFGVIQLSLIDTFSLNASGGFVYTENYLYTVEAFRSYFRHLSENGIFAVTRYFAPGYHLEILRLAGLVRAAWEAEGVANPAGHIVVLGQGIHFSVLGKHTPYTPEELEKIGQLAAREGMNVLYSPGTNGGGHSELRTLLTTSEFEELVTEHPFVITPPTDDRPFFFNLLRGRLAPGDIPDKKADPFQFMLLWHEAIVLMYLLIAVVTTAAVVFLVGPLFLLARRPTAKVSPKVAVPLLLYFACLGYGFMMIEVPVLQRFILVLGYPVYALVVVLFSLLVYSGIGSLLTTRLSSSTGTLLTILASIVLLSFGYSYGMPLLANGLLGQPLAIRIVGTVVVLAPLGLVLGMAYPLGIHMLREFDEGLVPWAWGLNGALSVVASVFAVFLGSRLGFTAASLTGVAAYGAAMVAVAIVARERAAMTLTAASALRLGSAPSTKTTLVGRST